jgi:hypothetical protein
MSGALVPVGAMVGDDPWCRDATVPDLDAQMREIVDFVVLQEQSWRPGRHSTDPFTRQSR